MAQPQCRFLLASRLSDNHDGPGAVKHHARPSGVLAAKSDIDAAGDVTLGILGRIADVQNLSARISHPEHFIEIDRMENLFQIVVESGRSRVLRIASYVK